MEKLCFPYRFRRKTNSIQVGRFEFDILTLNSNQEKSDGLLTPYHNEFNDESMVDDDLIASSLSNQWK